MTHSKTFASWQKKQNEWFDIGNLQAAMFYERHKQHSELTAWDRIMIHQEIGKMFQEGTAAEDFQLKDLNLSDRVKKIISEYKGVEFTPEKSFK